VISAGYQKLAEFARRLGGLTTGDAATFAGAFREMKVKKRQFIIQPTFPANHRNYVVSGALRAYVVGEEGSEHTISFAVEDWWITDYNSYIYQQPATMFVVALEDSVVLQIDYEHEQILKQTNHRFESLFRQMAERGLAFQQRRLIANLTLSAEERYDHFLQHYPQIARRVPQYALASYLGMTTEFLSKIRNNKVRKKS